MMYGKIPELRTAQRVTGDPAQKAGVGTQKAGF